MNVESVPVWRVGEITVQRIVEIELPRDTGAWLLPEATPELLADASGLPEGSVDEQGGLRLSVHTFAVRVGPHRVLVDTGVGNGKRRSLPAWNDLDTPFLHRLAAADFAPEDVDVVVNTHLHTDHVGWNTRWDGAAWVATFPSAAYVVSRVEYDHWAGQDLDAGRRQLFADSVEPVQRSGQLRLVGVPAGGHRLLPGVDLVTTPGHTPGHVAVRITSGGHSAVITGDCVHHPVQLARPDVGCSADVDPILAAATRQALFEELADTGALMLGSHFPAPSAGRVERTGNGYRLIPVADGAA